MEKWVYTSSNPSLKSFCCTISHCYFCFCASSMELSKLYPCSRDDTLISWFPDTLIHGHVLLPQCIYLGLLVCELYTCSARWHMGNVPSLCMNYCRTVDWGYFQSDMHQWVWCLIHHVSFKQCGSLTPYTSEMFNIVTKVVIWMSVKLMVTEMVIQVSIANSWHRKDHM